MNTNGQIVAAMIAAAEEIGVIGKDSRNSHQGYQFRGIDALVDRCGPILHKHGVIVLPSHQLVDTRDIESSGGGHGFARVVQAQFLFVHTDGSWVAADTVGEGWDYSDKGTNKAMSQAFKYALAQALTIPTGDADPDTDSPQATGRKPAKGSSRGSDAPSRAPSGSSGKKKAVEGELLLTWDDQGSDGWWPVVCPACLSDDIVHKTIKTKKGDSPMFQCGNRDCDTWPSYRQRDDGRNWPWSTFAAEEEEVWGPTGWVADHLGFKPERIDYDGDAHPPAAIRDDYPPDEAPF